MQISDEKSVTGMQAVLHALANRHRLMILGWLADPAANFPVQREGDLIEDGACVSAITDKTGLSQPTVTTHMQVLAKAGLVTPKRIKTWVYYRINAAVAERFLGDLGNLLRGS